MGSWQRVAVWSFGVGLTLTSATALASTERLRRAIYEIPGVPDGAMAVAQDAEGFIWIAGNDGLARFDGVTARAWAPEVISEYLEYVSIGPDGAVCAGNPRGRLYEVLGEGATIVRGRDLRPLRPVVHAAYDAAGALWTIVGNTVHRRGADAVWSPPTGYALEGEPPWRLGAARDGAMIVGTIEGSVFRLREGRPPVGIARGLGGRVNRIVVEEDGSILATVRGRGLVRIRDGNIELLLAEPSRPTGLTSRDGEVWAVFTGGVWWLSKGRPARRLDSTDGFAASASAFLDRDGGLWLTSFRGVEFYPQPNTVIWTARLGERERFRAKSVIPDARGGVWVATAYGPAFRRDGDRDDQWSTLDVGGWYTAHQGCLDGDGRVWVSAWASGRPDGYRTALLRWDAGEFSVHLERRGATHIRCDLDADATLWAAYGRDLVRLRPGEDEPAVVASIPASYERSDGFAIDPSLGLAAVYSEELCTAAGAISGWTCETVPDVGWLHDVVAGPDGRWWLATGAARVVARGQDGWEPVLPPGAIRDTRVGELTRSPRGGIWIATAFEKIRVEVGSPGDRARVVERLTGWNGVPRWASGAVAEQEDGTLWLPTAAGPLRVPSSARRSSPEPPALRMTGLTVDGSRVPPERSLSLGSGEHRIEATFSSFAYRDLDNLRYRMRAGSGPWSPIADPVVRLVGPSAGHHRIEVQASVDGATWSSPLPFRFSVAPMWYATPWPWVVAVAVLMALLYLLHRVRLAHLLHLERQRTAIAMDLHDEVGAAVGGIGIMAGVAADESSSSDQRLRVARRIAEAAEEVGAVLYDIIWSLRIKDPRLSELASQLTDRGARLFPGEHTAFAVVIGDDLQGVELSLQVRRNVQRIVVEAMYNAARHARADRVELGFARRRKGWVVWVEDDGVGLGRPSAGAGAGLGIGGMRRRAEQIGACLEIGRGPLGGTRVELRFHTDGVRWKPRHPRTAGRAPSCAEPEGVS